MTTTAHVNTEVATPAPFRDPKSGAGAVREAITALADVEATMDKDTTAIAAADPDLGNAMQTFRLDYQEYLRIVVKYAQRTRNASHANLEILATDGPRGLILTAKKNIGDSNPVAEKANEHWARAETLRERVLAAELAKTSWEKLLAGGFFGISIFGTATEASGDAVRITATKLQNVECHMNKIRMTCFEVQSKAESLECLREIFEEEPAMCEVLDTQVKYMYKDIVKDCNFLERIANVNYFKNFK